MAQAAPDEELLTLDEAQIRYGVKRSTLYRYIGRGELPTFRRAMDRRVYVRRADLESLRRFRKSEEIRNGPTLVAVERARLFQRRVFGDRKLSTPSADLVEESRHERTEELP